MDQGIAAVLGAGVGILGTLGAGVLGYVAALRQTRDQGRVDHGLRLRDERREIYLDFITVAERMESLIRELRSMVEPDEDTEPAWLAVEKREEELAGDAKQLSRLLTRITLAGPTSVREPAETIVEVLESATDFRREGADTQDDLQVLHRRLDEFIQQYERAEVALIGAVRQVLEGPPL
ncbi:hypothetical protein [Streptomyces sp. WAC 06738]|uniref:hypothetical protein n=1 Tax=Streptomyces sp. WAC 06738 TaxID=2203210 RepID=UPI000F7BB094|nr:hypothetical protein [Streptomyces sp. WAC 06738]